MEITYGVLLLASSNPALGRIGPSGMALNGQQVVDEIDLFRAIETTFYGREGKSSDLRFRVTALFATLREAQEFYFTHHSDIVANDDLTISTGETGDTSDVVLTAAAAASVSMISMLGLSVIVEYNFRGGLFAVAA